MEKTQPWWHCIQHKLQEADLTNHVSRVKRDDWQRPCLEDFLLNRSWAHWHIWSCKMCSLHRVRMITKWKVQVNSECSFKSNFNTPLIESGSQLHENYIQYKNACRRVWTQKSQDQNTHVVWVGGSGQKFSSPCKALVWRTSPII